MSDFKEEYKDEAEKIKELIAAEVELDLLRVFFKSYKFPEEKELLHIDFLKDYGGWISKEGNAQKLISILRTLANSVEQTFVEN